MQFLKYEHEWDYDFPLLLDDRSRFPEAGVVILKEEQKTELFERARSTVVTCTSVYNFRTDSAAQNFGLSLPPSVDPGQEYYDLPVLERSEQYRPKYPDLELIYLSSRIRKADGRIIVHNPVPKVALEVQVRDWLSHSYFAYHFDWEELEAGDQVEISWQYYLPYWQGENRVFFAGLVPSLASSYEFTYPANQLIIFKYGNSGQPYEIERITSKPARNFMRWKFRDRPAGLQEENSRPHLELPYMQYYIHDHYFAKYSGDAVERFVPYTWQYKYYRQLGNKRFNLYTIRKINGKEVFLNKFFASHTSLSQSPMEKLESVHELFNERFSFSADKEYLEGRDLKLERMVQHVKRKVFRKISRYRLYESMLNRIGENYHRVIVSDSRIGQIDAAEYMPIMGQEIFFAIQSEDSLAYLIPKKSRFGWHINELPFYYQKQRALLVGQMTENYLEEQVLRFVKLPGRSSEQNFRTQHFEVQVDPRQGRMRFEGEVALSGQFSTLLRGQYKYEAIDSTINPAYYNRVRDISNAVFEGQEVVQDDSDFPYHVKVREQFYSDNIVEDQGPGRLSIDLQAWFPFVYSAELLHTPRYTNYYPDFAGKDEFHYRLQFPEVISIVGEIEPVTVENDFGTFYFEIKQSGAKTIEMQAMLELTGSVLPAAKIALAKDIYNVIDGLQEAVLLLDIN